MLKKLKAGRAIQVIGELEQVIRRLRARQRAAVQSELEYFRTHRQRLNYPVAKQQGQPLGTGAIESTCASTNAGSNAPDSSELGQET